MTRNLIFTAIILAPVFFSGCGGGKPGQYALVTFISGDVKRNNAVAGIGEQIAAGDLFATGVNSFCDIRIGSSVFRVKSLSGVTLIAMPAPGKGGELILQLEKGMVLCKPDVQGDSWSFMVRTPAAVAGAKGAQFTVESDRFSTTRVRVFNGDVRVARRVKQLEADYASVFNLATPVKKEHMVIVSADEAKKAEEAVEAILKEETGDSRNTPDTIMQKVISRSKDAVVIKDDKIATFRVGEFIGENREIIEVEEKSGIDINKLAQMLKQDAASAAPEGRLLVSGENIYFIKYGKVIWESRVVGSPVRKKDRVYVADKVYVFCAFSDGPVIWKREIENDGNVQVKSGRLMVNSAGKKVSLNISTGEDL